MDDFLMDDFAFLIFFIVFGLLVASLLAIIPASIASNKGYGFGTWWIYGFLLFIVALIHSLVLEDRNKKQQTFIPYSPPATRQSTEYDNLVQLKQYKELLDCGAITEEEFNQKKKQLLNI